MQFSPALNEVTMRDGYTGICFIMPIDGSFGQKMQYVAAFRKMATAHGFAFLDLKGTIEFLAFEGAEVLCWKIVFNCPTDKVDILDPVILKMYL